MSDDGAWKPEPHWPDGVQPISWDALKKLGFNERTGALYWDGKRVETELRLSHRDRLLALIVALSTASMAITDLLRYAWGE